MKTASSTILHHLLRSAKRLLTYSPVGLWREHQLLSKAERTWKGRSVFFFPYLSTGGAEQVHADILSAIEDQHPLVVICGFSRDRAFADAYARLGLLLELPRLLHHPLTRHSTHERLALLINAQVRPVLFSSITNSFFDVLPLLKKEVRTYHLQHAFLYQPEGNIQHKGWLRHFPRVDGYLFISGQARAEFKLFLHAHAIPDTLWKKLHLMPNAVKHFGSVRSHERIGLLFVGRPSPEKRLELFLNLCDRLEARSPGSFRCSVVGADRIPGHAQVSFLGRVNDVGRMSEIYSNHDALVLTSSREGFPLVVMEAMAQGLAVISTPVGDVPNRLDPACAIVTSTIEATTVVDEMGAAILALDSDRRRLQAMKEIALVKATAEFDPALFRQRYRELLISPAS